MKTCIQGSNMKHIKLKTINLKNHPQLNERWLQDVIAEDPSVLGIGDVLLKDKERRHVGAGRLDLLLQDTDGYGRYEVEIQLGNTDESHIIRTIEYWDIERKKYPQYDHVAVIVAEDITSRFLNVIGLFNGHIPIMAIQVTAIETNDGVGLQFTKILDTVKLGYLDDDEETAELTDRNYWETIRGTKNTVSIADKILELAKLFAPSSELSYNKHYIGFWVDGRACNFAICKPQKNALRLEIRLQQTENTDEIITDSELDFLDYDKRWGRYRLKLTEQDILDKEETLMLLLKQAYELRK
jgi:predicted transport protein